MENIQLNVLYKRFPKSSHKGIMIDIFLYDKIVFIYIKRRTFHKRFPKSSDKMGLCQRNKGRTAFCIKHVLIITKITESKSGYRKNESGFPRTNRSNIPFFSII